ncbi:hypothetical protein FB00_05700 [Cellulosimicrobium funkei]|uniref:Uncharacterized protein n=1 Tax=Cellulosimicrobium funkei TaxID=264251 RepID=A0A0H2L6F0_9MICO|nr:hypothetical protein FB00_05700 [Cellulosimicrobium funkei]
MNRSRSTAPHATRSFWRARSRRRAAGSLWTSAPSSSAISHRPPGSRQPRSPRPRNRPSSTTST